MNTIVEIKLRKAEPEDFKIDNKTMRIGQPFWYKSLKTGRYSNHASILTKDTDLKEFTWQLKNGMIWVPINDLWLHEDKKPPKTT